MSASRFYLLLSALIFSLISSAQPYWQKGTQLQYLSGFGTLEGLGSSFTNGRFTATAGSSLFLDDLHAVGVEASIDRAPLTGTYTVKTFVQRKVYGASDRRSSLLLDLHVGLEASQSRTLSGSTFGSQNGGVGLGMQYTYWYSSRVGFFIWPQIYRTNAGTSGLWDWQLNLPVGLQWTLHRS